MAADTIVTGSKLTAIANAIRAKLGVATQYTLDQMATAIASIPSGSTPGAGAAKANVTRVFADGAIGSNADLVVTAAELLAAADRQGNVNLDYFAFYGSEWLRKITIPSGTYVSSGALCSCPNLEEIEVLGELIFSFSAKQPPSAYFTMPSSAPFINNPKLRSLDLSGFRPYGSAGNKQLPQYFCTCCPMLTSISLPTDSRYTKLGTYGFYGTAITDLVVPANFTYVPSSAFPNGTSSYGSTTSYNSLETVTFKGDITDVQAGNYAETFQTPAPASSPLRRIVFEGNTAVPTLNNAYLFYQYGDTRAAGNLPQNFDGIYVPDSLLTAWKAASNWSSYASIIKPISDLPTS